MSAILSIARTVFRESIRGQIFYGLLVFLALFLGFCVYFSSLALGNVARVITDTGMVGITLVGLTVTSLFGLYSLYQEKDRNELYVLINRISRGQYLLGRFLGALIILSLFILLMGVGIFLLARWIGAVWMGGVFLDVVMAILEFGMLTGIGFLFYALGLSFTLNSFLSLAVFVFGHSFDEAIQSFLALGDYGHPLHLALIKGLSYVLPNFDMFDFRLAIVHQATIPGLQVLLSLLYGCFYITMLLAGATMIMNIRDL